MWPEPSASPRLAVIAIVGAESTGKSTLTAALAQAIADSTGLATTWVPEVLREWCDERQRTPRADEQAGIAQEQARRITAAAAEHAVVLCDTTPLMTAVYHQQVFGDSSLDAPALRWQRQCQLTLLTALDLPWQADGLQRDGPHVRLPVDARLRELLIGARLPFTVVGGSGARRLDAAMDAVTPVLKRLARPGSGLFTRLAERQARLPDRPWRCEHCDSPECEHLLMRGGATTAR